MSLSREDGRRMIEYALIAALALIVIVAISVFIPAPQFYLEKIFENIFLRR